MKPLHDLSDDELAHWAHRALALPDAPPAWIARAIALRPAAAPASSVAEVLQAGLRLVQATLRFDSWATPAAPLAVRSGGSRTRHLLFSAAGRDVDLRISPGADGYTLTGQVLGPDDSGEVALVYPASAGSDAGAALTRRAPVDELGEFRLTGLAAGDCTVTFHLDGDQVVLPPITLGDATP